MLQKILFIARHDLLNNLRQRETLFWLFVMPPIFIFFIGSATGGFGGGSQADRPDRITLIEKGTSGVLADQLVHQLEQSNFAVTRRAAPLPETDAEGNPVRPPFRSLTVPDGFTQTVLEGGDVDLPFSTRASALDEDYDVFRVNRAAFTVLADLAAVRAAKADAGDTSAPAASDFEALNAAPRTIAVDASPAGRRQTIPSGFEQAVPGNLVMFTMLVLLTSGSVLLVVERRQGLLRRLASAPMNRGQIVSGKWLSRLILGFIQIVYAMILGTSFFAMDWGPDLPMIFAVLIGWAALCASGAFLLGSLANSEGQATGFGVLASLVLASLGGCWWPVEITPEWMQSLSLVLPSGWTMDALHKLVSFQAGAASALPHTIALWVSALIVGIIAVNRFRYQ